MFLANNTVFWVEKACYEIFRLNIYSYQRLCCEKKCSFVYLEYQYSVFKKKSNGIWNASEFVL